MLILKLIRMCQKCWGLLPDWKEIWGQSEVGFVRGFLKQVEAEWSQVKVLIPRTRRLLEILTENRKRQMDRMAGDGGTGREHYYLDFSTQLDENIEKVDHEWSLIFWTSPVQLMFGKFFFMRTKTLSVDQSFSVIRLKSFFAKTRYPFTKLELKIFFGKIKSRRILMSAVLQVETSRKPANGFDGICILKYFPFSTKLRCLSREN